MPHFFHIVLSSCCTFFVLHFGQVALFPCCTFFMLHYFILQVSRDALFSCCTNSMLHFFSWYTLFKLHFFRVWFVVVLLHVALCSCYTFFLLNSFQVALFLCCTFLYFLHVAPFFVLLHVELFLCCSFFVLPSFHFAFFHVEVFSRWTLFMLLFFRVAHFLGCTFSVRVTLFSSCTLFMLHLFPYCILFILNVFLWCTVAIFLYFFRVVSCCTFFVLRYLNVTVHSSCTILKFYFFHTVDFSSWTFFVVHFFALFSCCTFFRVGLFSWCTFFLLHIFSCRTLFTLQFFHVTLFSSFHLHFWPVSCFSLFLPFFLLLFLTLSTFHINVSCCTHFMLKLFPEAHFSYGIVFSNCIFPKCGNGCYTKLALNPLQTGFAFLYPLKTSENLKVFWCFQGVKKSNTGLSWVNQSSWSLAYFECLPL